MSSKYHGLPDIDTAADVYETVDEPETVLRPGENGMGEVDTAIKPASENIDASGLPARRKAERVFGRGKKRPDALIPPFRLPPLSHRRGSSSSSSSSEGLYDKPKETPIARIRRLKAELAEVEKEVLASSSSGSMEGPSEVVKGKRKSVLPPRPATDLLGELAGLRERLSAVDLDGMGDGPGMADGVMIRTGWNERLAKLGESSKALMTNGDIPDHLLPDDISQNPPARLSDLDKRLTQLEDLIGPNDTGSDTSPTPLLQTLSKLDHLSSLLTQPRHLDAISRRIKLLLVDLDRAAIASRRNPSSTASHSQPDKSSAGVGASSPNINLTPSEYTQLQTLFSLLPRLDPLLPIIPPLLGRLKSLSGLHAEAAVVADGLNRLVGDEKRSEEELKELKEVLGGVKEGLDGAVVGIRRNWEGLEGRMKGLEERVRGLSE